MRVCWPGVITRLIIAPAGFSGTSALEELTAETEGYCLGDGNYWKPDLSKQLSQQGVEMVVPFKLASRDRPNFRIDKKLRKSGFRRFTIPQGLPPRLWVLISRGNQWLDYRDLDLRESSLSSLSDDVVIDLPDVCVEISGLISRGESEEREFKEEVSGENKKSFLKTVSAFANGKGGVVLIGVVDNTGEIRGIQGVVNKEKDRLTNMIRDNIVPQPNIHIQNCKINGKQLIAIYVEEGDSPPYGLDAAKPTFYVRRGATTFQATQHEIRVLAKKHDRQVINQYWKF